jgi:hypothetical protein
MISLNGSLRTCKVNTAWANKIQSDRFENPNLMSCPVWSGRDLTGRLVCENSFMTKTAGCDSASDRVLVENAQRPQYSTYTQLDAEGIMGTTNMNAAEAKIGTAGLQSAGNNGPTWTTTNRGTIYQPCESSSTTAYAFAQYQNGLLANGAANMQSSNSAAMQSAGMW